MQPQPPPDRSPNRHEQTAGSVPAAPQPDQLTEQALRQLLTHDLSAVRHAAALEFVSRAPELSRATLHALERTVRFERDPQTRRSLLTALANTVGTKRLTPLLCALCAAKELESRSLALTLLSHSAHSVRTAAPVLFIMAHTEGSNALHRIAIRALEEYAPDLSQRYREYYEDIICSPPKDALNSLYRLRHLPARERARLRVREAVVITATLHDDEGVRDRAFDIMGDLCRSHAPVSAPQASCFMYLLASAPTEGTTLSRLADWMRRLPPAWHQDAIALLVRTARDVRRSEEDTSAAVSLLRCAADLQMRSPNLITREALRTLEVTADPALRITLVRLLAELAPSASDALRAEIGVTFQQIVNDTRSPSELRTPAMTALVWDPDWHHLAVEFCRDHFEGEAASKADLTLATSFALSLAATSTPILATQLATQVAYALLSAAQPPCSLIQTVLPQFDVSPSALLPLLERTLHHEDPERAKTALRIIQKLASRLDPAERSRLRSVLSRIHTMESDPILGPTIEATSDALRSDEDRQLLR